MAKDHSPDADDQLPEKKSSQQLLLLLLLLLIVLFGYLYFFTGVIRPRPEGPKPQPVAEAPVVKTPLPPRPAAKADQTAPAAGEKKGGEAAAPGKAGAPSKEATAAKPAPGAKEAAAPKPAPGKETAAKPGAKEAGKPVAKEAPAGKGPAGTAAKAAPGAKEAPGKPAVAGAKPGAPAGEAKGAKPAAQAKGAQPPAQAKEAKAAPAAGKPQKAGAEKKPVEQAAAGKPGSKKAAQAKPAEKEAAAPKAVAVKPKAAYVLELDQELAESEMGSVLAKLKKAGIGHVVQTKTHKGEPMHRLFLADFSNREEAAEELDRLKLAAPSAFMLKENGRYAVYAGSYMRDAKAAGEQSRLQTKGVETIMKSATLPVSVLKVRAGAFADHAAAERAAKSLQKAGLSAKVVHLAKNGK